MLELDDVAAAARRLDGVAHRTPVLTSRTLDTMVGATVHLKAECFQRTGAFKFRGAYNAIASLTPEQRSRGIITYSSGNHGQAIALAAQLHDLPATIVMPQDAPAIKMAATAGYGATIVHYDRYGENREEIANKIVAKQGAMLIPPFDHPAVMAGQGTVALELFEQAGPLDMIVACVGGGGLISGCATVAKSHGDVRVVGVEPVDGDDVKQSLDAGQIVTIETPRTIADGQQTTAPSERTFEVMRERVDEIALVTDDEIITAMKFGFDRLNVVLEPSGASALAAILAGHIDVAGLRVGITLSGGNVDHQRFAQLVS